jgi:hypothetical protein
MDDQQKPESSLSEFGRLYWSVNQIPKYGTVVVVVAFATAFLFDFVFWQSLDDRMLSFFVLADHVQTAVMTVALILGIVASLIVIGVIQHLISVFRMTATKRAKWMLGMAVLLVGVTGLLITFRATNVAIKYVAGITWSLATLVIGDTIANSKPVWDRKGFVAFLFYVVPVAWIALTILVAVASAEGATANRTTTDIIKLDRDAELSGRVIRLLGRGVVLRDEKDGRIMFVPKEQIRRIDQDVPRRKD